MENLKINKKIEQTTATYTKGGYRVEITYNVDKTSVSIDSINMSIYGDANGNYLGNANASSNGSELTYNISSVPQSKLSEVSALIEEVNSAIAANIASEAAE
ncbi:hypothetical protein KUA52_09010 [Prevotella copri]|uniref:hypothetical protein n=1 Tax=Segatella copri TaxID=165179 RepID=UPI001C444B9F|nr:hypothetical protein [Segatella copri]MBW0034441.1 hypothetical protein [Segatella copri]